MSDYLKARHVLAFILGLILGYFSTAAKAQPLPPPPPHYYPLQPQDLETYRVPCQLTDNVWDCKGRLPDKPDCLAVDSHRMVCEGAPFQQTELQKI